MADGGTYGDIVRALWARFRDEGLEAALEIVDEDVVWQPHFTGGRLIRGAAELRATLAALDAQGRIVDARLAGVEERGQMVIASGTLVVRRDDGRLEESSGHWVYHFRKGRLRRMSAYESHEDARAAVLAVEALAAAPPDAFDVEETREPEHGRTLRPTGELDIATAPRLERALAERVAPGERLVLDLGDLQFIDSTGLRVIVRAVETARQRGCDLRLRHGPPAVRRVFELSGVGDALPFEEP
jgi:anti-sigma B factor antagonist/stage II sporulation protein AA (anti-sigma F factor antagonist)